eukprot:CAMPEP_0172662010 /NCGR_PEP_ID=MMETSP1074-20121228/5083_1 /TAXON_ID=2916 /ORGANISM="Ceratium fusus, Strain PA161109" /LENGTH=535 /DNA_ID=CAMNT_0013477865 /DNA_START=57 /DNA_END=1664 /DNA_ORIENTATION=-
MSDGSLKSLELWNDGPAIQAILGQMQQSQVQMQQHLQDQLQQLHLQMGTLQQVQAAQPQQPYGLPIWPQPLLAQMPLLAAGQQTGLPPVGKRSKVRVGKLGKRERAEMRAGSSSKGPCRIEQQTGEESDVEQGWLFAAAQDRVQVNKAKVESPDEQQHVDAVGQTKNAESMDVNAAILKECSKLASAGVTEMTDIVSSSKAQLIDAIDALKVELRESLAKGMEELNVTVEDKMQSMAYSDVSIESIKGHVRELHKAVGELKVTVEDRMQIMAHSDVSMKGVKGQIGELHEAMMEATNQSHRAASAGEAASKEMTNLREWMIQADAKMEGISTKLRNLGALSRGTHGVNEVCDAASQCVPSHPLPLPLRSDKFDGSCTDSSISLSDSDLCASSVSSPTTWSFVYGSCEVSEGHHEWTLKIETIGTNWMGDPSMIVGIASGCTAWDRHFKQSGRVSVGFGFVASGEKYNAKAKISDEYASPYNTGDAVSVVLDMTTKTLSFKKNGQNLGIAYSNLPHSTYRLVVSFYGLGQKVKLAS